MKIRRVLITLAATAGLALGGVMAAGPASAQLGLVTDLLGGLLGGVGSPVDVGEPLPMPSPTGGQSTSAPR